MKENQAPNLEEFPNQLQYISWFQLLKELSLFYVMNSARWNRLAKWVITKCIEKRIPIEWILKGSVFSHFCGGESIHGCLKRIQSLSNKNISTILDYSKESATHASYESGLIELEKTIVAAAANGNISFAVFKFSSLADTNSLEALSKDPTNKEYALDRKQLWEKVNHLCQLAHKNNVRVLIDAEQSWIQNIIDEVTEAMLVKYNADRCIVFHTIQLYRSDRLKYMQTLHKRLRKQNIKSGFKLVRGAYLESETARAQEKGYSSPLHNDKRVTDNDFNKAITYCMMHREDISICAGTHNVKSSELLMRQMDHLAIQKSSSKVYFAQLLGMADNISCPLASLGYNVAKYVPYGRVAEVIPYLIRRIDENNSIQGELSNELDLRIKELKRRINKTI